MTAAPTFFLAGVMQGSRAGADLADQGYRTLLGNAIRRRLPEAVVIDPGAVMWDHIRTPKALVGEAHARLREQSEVRREALEEPIRELVGAFHHLTDLAAQADVCVAWLPEHEASMGTAAEMFAAFRAGRRVVAITPMRQNLAVLACATAIVADVKGFARWLAEHADELSSAAGRPREGIVG